MIKILNFALKIKGVGREGGTCEVLRPCQPPKIWQVHRVPMFSGKGKNCSVTGHVQCSRTTLYQVFI